MKLLFKKIYTFSTIFVFLMLVGVWPVLGEGISDILTAIPDQPKINTELSKIDITQYASKLDNEKYLYQAPYEKDGFIFTTHEYKTPKGEIGYQTIINTGTELISTATGVEANDRTYTIKKSDLIYEKNNL